MVIDDLRVPQIMVGKSVLTTRDWIPESSPLCSRLRSWRMGSCCSCCVLPLDTYWHMTVTGMRQDIDGCDKSVHSILDIVVGLNLLLKTWIMKSGRFSFHNYF